MISQHISGQQQQGTRQLTPVKTLFPMQTTQSPLRMNLQQSILSQQPQNTIMGSRVIQQKSMMMRNNITPERMSYQKYGTVSPTSIHTQQQPKIITPIRQSQVNNTIQPSPANNKLLATANLSYQNINTHNNHEQKSNLTSQMETLLNENDKLIKIIEEKNEEIKVLKNHNSSVNQSVVDTNKEKEIQSLQQQLNEEKSQFKSFKTKILMVIEENEKLQQMYEQLSNDYNQLEMNMKNNFNGNSSNVQFMKLQEENKLLKQRLQGQDQSQLVDELQQKVNILQATNDELKQQVEQNSQYLELKRQMLALINKF